MGKRIIRSGVYQIVNEVNGKSYVGSSVDITNRWNHWRNCFRKEMKYKSLLKLAILKYGIECFTFILLGRCEPTKEALEALEQHYIDALKPAYNILPKAYSAIGNKSRLGQTNTPEQREAHSAYQTAKMADPEIRASVAQAMRVYRSEVKYQGGNVKGSKRSAQACLNIGHAIRNSEKHKASTDGRKGLTTPCSFSGEYGVRWMARSQNWCVLIEGKKYGLYYTIEAAIRRRDQILAINPSERLANKIGRASSSGHYGISWSKQRQVWNVQIKRKHYGSFDTIEVAIVRRDAILPSIPK